MPGKGRHVPLLAGAWPRAVACLVPMLLSAAVHGQSIKGVRASAEAVEAGSMAFVEVELAPVGGSVWCGLRIDFGNGTSRDIRVGDNDRADLNLRVPVQYASPGDYQVKVSGRQLARGLRSALPCEGEARSIVLRVLRPSAGAAAAPAAVAAAPVAVAPVAPASPAAGPSTEVQLADLRAELARLQEELRQQQAALLRAQSSPAPAAPPPVAPAAPMAPMAPAAAAALESLPAATMAPPPSFPAAPGWPPPGPVSMPGQMPQQMPGQMPGQSLSGLPPPSMPGQMAPPMGPGPGSPGGSTDASSSCGPNPTPDCAARVLVEGISRLRDVLRRRPSQAAAPGGSPPPPAGFPGGSPPPMGSSPPMGAPPPMGSPGPTGASGLMGSPAPVAAAPAWTPPPMGTPPASPAGLPPPGSVPAARQGQDQGATSPGCTPGRTLEPREYAQPEFIGRPPGRTARMCFFRSDSPSRAEQLNFHPNGHFVMTGVTGSGGFAMAGAVMGTVRGTYGFQEGRVVLRVGYAGTGVTQSGGGAGAPGSTDVSASSRAGREVVLPNCQRISVRQEGKALQMPAGDGHPAHLVLDGQRWEQMRIDCPAWQGWQNPAASR